MCVCVGRGLPSRPCRFTARKERHSSAVTTEFDVLGGVLYDGSGLTLMCLVGCIYVYPCNLTDKPASQSVNQVLNYTMSHPRRRYRRALQSFVSCVAM